MEKEYNRSEADSSPSYHRGSSLLGEIKSALTRDAHIASYKKEKYLRVCKQFEKKYSMDSNEFMDKLESGKLDDRDDFFDWYAAKKGLDIWDRRLRKVCKK